MDVSIKSFEVAMDVKNKGIELAICEPNGGKRLGGLIVTKTHLIWCEGNKRPETGTKIKWTEFAEIVNAAQKPTAKKTAVKKVVKKVAKKKAAAKTVVETATPVAGSDIDK
jgi:hypothetical protein